MAHVTILECNAIAESLIRNKYLRYVCIQTTLGAGCLIIYLEMHLIPEVLGLASHR